MKEANKKLGRPVGSTAKNTLDTQLPVVRTSKDQLETYKDASKRAGMTFSAWVRSKLDKASQ